MVYGKLDRKKIGGELTAQLVKDEHGLLSQIAAGDERAFSQLFDCYFQMLLDFSFRLTGSLDVAEEIVQEAFVKVWQGREDLLKIKKIEAYLFILCRNHGISYLRQRARDYVRLRAYVEEGMSEIESDLPQEGHSEQLYVIIEQAICALPKQRQKVFRLAKLNHFSHAEIADQLGISAETVKKHMKLALRSIREFVKKKEYVINSLLILLFWLICS